MRSARAALRTALPLVTLGGLALNGLLHGAASAPPVAVALSAGYGAVAPSPLVRVITDGHPQLILLPVRRTHAAPAARPTTARPHAVHLGRSRSVAAPRTATAPAPTTAPRVATRTVSDTYPWASDTSGGADPWGFTKRQCVSYVAWRLADAGRPLDNARDRWGSALSWDDTARRLGRPVSTHPSVGAVAQWDAGESSAYWSPGSSRADGSFVAGGSGHVAWVVDVYSDGSVLVAQYNGMGDRAFSTMRVKAPRYLSL